MFDLGTGILTLSFSEAIEPLKVDYNELNLQNSSNDTTNVFSFSRFTISESDPSSVLTITLNRDDINAIKAMGSLGTNENNTFLSFTEIAFEDVFGNGVAPRPSDNAFQATDFRVDMTPPILLNYIFDMNQGIITLNFSESIQVNTFNSSGLTVQSSTAADRVSETLNGGSLLDDSGALIRVMVLDANLNNIKANRDLATDQSNTFLSINFNTFEDTSGVSGNAINPALAEPPSQYIPDRTEPELRIFSIDMGTGLLSLTFSETVDPDTFNATRLVLQSSPLLPVSSRRLTSGTTSSPTGPVIEFIVPQVDLDFIKSRIGFGTANFIF